jgi:hypothetical protein
MNIYLILSAFTPTPTSLQAIKLVFSFAVCVPARCIHINDVDRKLTSPTAFKLLLVLVGLPNDLILKSNTD